MRASACVSWQVGIRATFDNKRNAFIATATQPIPAGRELLFYYGSLCHEAWINLYGFAPPDARPCPKPPSPKAAGKAGKAAAKPPKGYPFAMPLAKQGKKSPLATKKAGVKLVGGKLP